MTSAGDVDELRSRLRARGLRLTPQRELILAAVDDLGHATPEEILHRAREHSSAINASTVYRTLETLEEVGLVRHAHLSDRAPTYHSVSGHAHFHLVCRGCREVRSVPAEAAYGLVERLAKDHGFTPDIGHLALHGLCRDCEGDD